MGNGGVLEVLRLPGARPQAQSSLPGQPGSPSSLQQSPTATEREIPTRKSLQLGDADLRKVPAVALAVTSSLRKGHAGDSFRERDKGQDLWGIPERQQKDNTIRNNLSQRQAACKHHLSNKQQGGTKSNYLQQKQEKCVRASVGHR